MKKIVLLACLLGLFTVSLNAGTYGGGSGTSGAPYIIATFAHLQELQSTSGDWGAYFEQTANVTTSGTWTPIGNSSTKFTGTYDGGGFTISDLYINNSGSTNQGFFGYARYATIKNLGVTDCDITGAGSTGGLIGYQVGGTVTNCYVTGGSVSGTGSYVGGLIGYQINGSVDTSYARISVSGTTYVGGLIGNQYSGSVTNCYARGSVSGTGTVVGGLNGYQGGTITNCYSTGLVYSPVTNLVGGLVGQSVGTATACFWDTGTSGQSTSPAGTGATTAEMTNATITNNIFLDAGWDFKGVGAEGIWNIGNGRNDGYPYLNWEYSSDPGTLPVELSTFNAMYNTVSGFVSLNWATASETDVIGFNIYRHTENSFGEADKINFDLIAGAGTTTQTTEYSFADETADPCYTTYYYWLEVVNYDGTNDNHGPYTYIPIDVNQDGELSVITSTLSPCFPNPARIGNEIRFSFRVGGLEGTSRNVELKVYNILGKLVATVVDEELVVNNYTRSWSPQNLSNGVYFYQLKTDNYSNVQKMMLVR